MKLPSYLSLIGLALATSSCITAQSSQPRFGGGRDSARLKEVVAAFELNWKAYKQYAYGHDRLAPISKAAVDDSTLGAHMGTIVESLSTHIVLGLGDSVEYKELLNMIKTIDFTTTPINNGEVSLFEMTIRYIGGLTSAYHLNGEKKEEYFLIEQAQRLADALSVGWQGGNRIPFNAVNLNQKKPANFDDSDLAQAGSLTLEWLMLSKYTGNPKYAKLATGSVDAIISSPPHFPSLWANRIQPNNNSASSTYISTGGGCDSFIEYLVKYPVLLNDKNHRFAETYGKLVDTIQKELVSKSSVNNLTFIADYNIEKKEQAYVGSHLASFIGGNLAYAGRLFGRDDWTQLGLEITESYYQSYRASALGIGGYSFGWFDKSGLHKGWTWINDIRRRFFNKNGLFVVIGAWVQGPETIESLFYAWRITRDEKFRDMAWEAFQQIKKQASTDTAYAGIQNVNDPATDLYDQTDTYLFSELFKYLYLIFEDPHEYSLDDYVFTTEGHVYKRGAGAMDSKSKSKSKSESDVATWGSVQGQAFKYEFLMDEKAIAKSTSKETAASLDDINNDGFGQVKMQTQVKPSKIKEVTSGSKQDHVNVLASQLDVDPKVLNSYLATLPEHPVLKSRKH